MMEVLSKNDHGFAFIGTGDNYVKGNEIDGHEMRNTKGFQNLILEDKDVFEDRGNDENLIIRV